MPAPSRPPSARRHGPGGRAGLPLVVPVLLGILLMHGGLSAQPTGRPPATTIAAPTDARRTMAPSPPAGSATHHHGGQRDHGGHPDHGGHDGGSLCLAFLRGAGVLLLAGLLAAAVSRAARSAPRLPAVVLARTGRSPPSGRAVSSAVPLFTSLCVLRR
ncbi:DUF6153 family protein [Candidatus Frankia nodulisporulans]|uniref:DUF6153 family protein n=1 Tax=Candidatus Frankia nodulisporulans TaxID=2060052 RepID=UPI00158340A4|nr:DUF6153 family protein [Candidatus Frankia nodulisporulans]